MTSQPQQPAGPVTLAGLAAQAADAGCLLMLPCGHAARAGTATCTAGHSYGGTT